MSLSRRGLDDDAEICVCFLFLFFFTVLQSVFLWAWSPFVSFSRSPLHNTPHRKAMRMEGRVGGDQARRNTDVWPPRLHPVFCWRMQRWRVYEGPLRWLSHSVIVQASAVLVKWFHRVGGQSSGGVRLIFLFIHLGTNWFPNCPEYMRIFGKHWSFWCFGLRVTVDADMQSSHFWAFKELWHIFCSKIYALKNGRKKKSLKPSINKGLTF